MGQAARTLSRQQSRTSISSIVTLAFWRIRHTWRLLLLAGFGILVAVTLVCTVPLYAQVALTAGLRGVLNATPHSAEITLQTQGNVLISTTLAQEYQSFNDILQQHLGTYLSPGPILLYTRRSST